MSYLRMTLRDALRSLAKTPVFSLATMLVLALGLGANLTFFNALHALLWRPLAFSHPEQLMFVQLEGEQAAGFSATGRDCAVLREHVAEVAEIGMTEHRDDLVLLPGDSSKVLTASGVNSGFLRALDLKPLAGRLFGPEEDLGNPGEERAVLTSGAWRSRFGSDPAVVGSLIPGEFGATRRPVRIIGILAPGATLPFVSDAEILTAIPCLSPEVRSEGSNPYRTLVRLKPGISRVQASTRISSVFKALGNLGPEFPLDRSYRLDPLRQALAPAKPTVLFLLYGAAGLLLLLTSANVASLLFSRALARRQEMAVRTALGAELRHLFGAYFLESLLLCAGGLILALGLDVAARPMVLVLLPELHKVGPELLRPGWGLLLFGFALCLGVAFVLAALSSLTDRRFNLSRALGQGGPTATEGRHPLRSALVSIQVAVILVLMTVGCLLTRSFTKALTLDPGFNPNRVVSFDVDLPAASNAWTSAGFDLQGLALEVPGTRGVTFSKGHPLGKPQWICTLGNHPGPPLKDDPEVNFLPVSAGYFEVLQARMKEGRGFTEAEVRGGGAVVVLNASAARLLFPEKEPLGQTVHLGMGDRMATVIGIVGDFRSTALDQAVVPFFYVPYFQNFGSFIDLSVRTDLPAAEFQKAFRSRLRAWNGDARIGSVRALSDLAGNTLKERFRATVLIGGVALLGLLIGSAGLYGTLTTQVAQGLREMSIRMALGARTGEILNLVLLRGARQVAAGVAVGLLGGWGAARLLEHQLFGIGPFDPVSFASATLILGSACFVSSLVPAWRAASADPAQVLRME